MGVCVCSFCTARSIPFSVKAISAFGGRHAVSPLTLFLLFFIFKVVLAFERPSIGCWYDRRTSSSPPPLKTRHRPTCCMHTRRPIMFARISPAKRLSWMTCCQRALWVRTVILFWTSRIVSLTLIFFSLSSRIVLLFATLRGSARSATNVDYLDGRTPWFSRGVLSSGNGTPRAGAAGV